MTVISARNRQYPVEPLYSRSVYGFGEDCSMPSCAVVFFLLCSPLLLDFIFCFFLLLLFFFSIHFACGNMCRQLKWLRFEHNKALCDCVFRKLDVIFFLSFYLMPKFSLRCGLIWFSMDYPPNNFNGKTFKTNHDGSSSLIHPVNGA